MSARTTPQAKAVAPPAPAKRPALSPAPARRLQRKCACGGSSGPGGGECEECRKKRLQRSAAGPGVASVPPIVDRVLASPGRPLDTGVRQALEPRFGHDFSRVRVHDDAQAAESARAVHAHAYTVGEDVVFAAGRYDPGSSEGFHLLAHELAHTVQQSGLQRRAADLSPGGSLEPQLEREAEAAARAVTTGGGAGPLTPLAMPLLSRAEATAVPPSGSADSASAAGEPAAREWEEAPDPLKKLGVTQQSKIKAGVPPEIQAFRLPVFPLPPQKGPRALALWQSLAATGGLEATIDSGSKAALWQAREPHKLRERWLTKVKWTASEAPKLWQAIGGEASPSFSPRIGGKTCHMDHIVELQISGNNTPENIQLLDGTENVESGGEVYLTLKSKAEAIRAVVPGLKEVILHYDSVEQKSAVCNACCLAEEKAAGKPGTAQEEGAENNEDYPIKAGLETRLRVPKGHQKLAKSTPVELRKSKIAQNQAASRLIPGMSLEALRLKPGNDTVDAMIDTVTPKTRLPLTIAEDKSALVLNVTPATGELKLSAKSLHPNIAFTYPYLSKGTITELQHGPEGLSGKGKLTPSIPFLSKMVLGVSFGPNHLEISSGLDPKKISPPIPGAKITKAELSLALFPEFKPAGALDFELAPGGKKLLEAALTAEKDAQGFVARGKLRAYIPGVDNAEGNIEYRPQQGWSGGITVESTQIKLPYVKSGTVTVGFNDKGIFPQGTVVLEVPGGHVAEVKLQRLGSKWIYSGKGTFKIPRLKETQVALTYDGDKLYGEGSTGFTLLGLDGKIKLFYSAKADGGDAKVWGDGELAFERKRAKGRLKVGMNPKQKFYGEGSLTYQVTEELIAMAGVSLDENEKLRIKGGLAFPKPIVLFKPLGGNKELFKAGIKIPIPGASIGPIGLVVTIDGALGARYSIGPGELRNARIETAINPLDDNPDLDIQIGATLYVPASAGIYGSIRGAVAIDAKLASLSGGLTVTAAADLAGKLESVLLLRYQKSRFELSAPSEISAGLTLGLKLDADITAEAGIGYFSVKTTKVWNLASYKYDTGLKFGMKAKLYYASDQPFKAPSMDEIEWVKPELKVPDLLEGIMRRATTKEGSA